MNDEDKQRPDHALRERIVSLMRSNERAHQKAVPEVERQKLKAAVSRLDQMLKQAAAEDAKALGSAVARLDQMLADIDKGKDITGRIRQRKPKE